jgi:adenylosuccinate synthase
MRKLHDSRFTDPLPLTCVLFALQVLNGVQVEYITLPGWKQDITGVRSFEDLPKNAKAYIAKVAEILGVPGANSSY